MFNTKNTVLFLTIYAIASLFYGTTVYCTESIHDVVEFVDGESDYSWDTIIIREEIIREKGLAGLQMTRPEMLLPNVELLGALRHVDAIPTLAKNLFQPSFGSVPPRAYVLYPCIAALTRHDSTALESVLAQCKNGYDPFIVEGYFGRFLPKESFLAIIDEYVEKNVTCLDSDQKQRLLEMKALYLVGKNAILLPPLSDFVLNHPLYLARQSAIADNLAILTEQKEIDAKTFSAVAKLGELRAVEAVEPLVPILLVKPKTASNDDIDERFDSIKDYPVAIALAQIGIPSIWGLLNEIAANDHDANNHDSEYCEVAYKTMTVILPSVAIPGFVNEVLGKQTEEIAHRRLCKIYPLMGLEVPVFEPRPLVSNRIRQSARVVIPEDDDGKMPKTNVTHQTIVISREDLRRPSDTSHALPEAPNRWAAIIIGNLIFIALYLLLWWMFYKRKS